MPVYEYVCQDCNTRFDALRKMAQADDPIACEKCNGEHTSRALSVFYAQSSGGAIASSGNGCGSCSGGSCSSCGI